MNGDVWVYLMLVGIVWHIAGRIRKADGRGQRSAPGSVERS